MLITEVGTWKNYDNITNENPFFFSIIPAKHTAATYWTDIFLAEDESNGDVVFIDGFRNGVFEQYTKTLSQAECLALESSFYFDFSNQILYVHFDHESDPYAETYSYQTFYGFSKEDIIYIDDIEFLPQIETIPSLAQNQDLLNYSRPNYPNGSIIFSNIGGVLDYFKDENLYGNNVFVSYIDPDDISVDSIGNKSATRSDVQRIFSFIIDDYLIGMRQITLRTQDIRSSGDKKIPENTFESSEYPDLETQYQGKYIPLCYGQVRERPCTPVNGLSVSGLIGYRVAETMTDFGTIQVSIDGVWTTKTAITIDLAGGYFELSRTDAIDTSGAIRECKVLDSIGIVNTSAADVIKDLNERFLGIPFTSTFYDTAEFNSESAFLTEIGKDFNSLIFIGDAIYQLQNESNLRFRYDINAEGLRTLRIDDDQRNSSGIIFTENIQNLYDINIDTDKALVYSSVKVRYNKSSYSGAFISETNNDYRNEVIRNYQKDEQLVIDTSITNQTDAEQRASIDSLTFSNIPEIVTLIINTSTKEDRSLYLKMRLLDVYKTALTYSENIDFDHNEIIDGREFYKIQYIKIISINPDPDQNIIEIKGKLLPNYIIYFVDEDGTTNFIDEIGDAFFIDE